MATTSTLQEENLLVTPETQTSIKRRRTSNWLTIYSITKVLSLSLLLLLTLTQTKRTLSYNLDYLKALPKFGPRGSYFGYSIAQHANFDTSNENATYRSYVVVGAPRADSLRSTGSVQRPGAIYKCDFSLAESCSLLDIDAQSNSLIQQQQQQSSLTAYSLGSSAQDKSQQIVPTSFITAASRDPVANRSDQWLGVSVKSQGPNGYAVVCAHRHVLQGPSYRWPQGICYSLTRNLTLHKTWQPCLNRPVNKAHEEYGTCQVGTASDISDTSDIVLGAPGPYTWRGTIFSNSIAFTAKDDRTWYMAPVQDEEARVYKYSYLGMSLVTGRFFQSDKQYYVSGAPRSNEMGQVLVMSKQARESNLRTDQILDGEQLGSAFGYTLAKLDFNGDGRQDLAVAAPFYYSKNDAGAVYLYANDGKSFVLNRRLTGRQPEGRFGFALANCGDLNHDKYDDLAIGAPYEQPGGVVYIHLGSPEGLRKDASQRIEGSSVRSGMQTFGYSLTGGLDMDKNGYPDLVVGSYADDAVFILRGRPIIEIATKIEGNLTRIDPHKTHCDGDRNNSNKLPCFKFNACFELNQRQIGKYSDSMKLKYRIEAETFTGQKYSRVKFQESEQTKTPNVVEKEIILNDHHPGRRCNVQRVYLHDRTDVQTPIQFKLSYTLEPPASERQSSNRYTSLTSNQLISYSSSSSGLQVTSSSSSSNSAQESNPAANIPPPFPILNQEEAERIFSARFLKDCGSNEICESHLDVDGQLQMPRETLGINEPGYSSDKQVNVTIRVANNMEPAYEARLFVTHPPQLTYSGFKASKQVSIVECIPVERNLIKCELGNPMTKGTSKLLMLFNTQNQAGTFDFNLMVNTTSQNAKEARTSYDMSGTIKRKIELPPAPKLPPSYPEPPMQEPPAWLILLSVLLGILLFAALFYCLYVNGFFERSKARYTAASTEERF